MVKGAARNQPNTSTATGSGSALPPSLPSMATGQNPSDPLTLLNGPMGHGVMAGFNPFQGMGVNTADPNFVSILPALWIRYSDTSVFVDAIDDGLARILRTHGPDHGRPSNARPDFKFASTGCPNATPCPTNDAE